jgi:hypothetical protein
MFGRSNVYAMVTAFGVRVKDEREQDRNHLVETTFQVPLTFDLAEEILPAMAHDLFSDNGTEMVPRPEIQEAAFNLPLDPQLLQIRNHPDLEPDVKLDGVTVRKIKAKKADGGSWLLVFTCTWVMGDPASAITMIQRLKLGVYLSFQVQEPKLDLQPPDETVDGEVVGSGPKPADGAMVPAKKKRGRPKKAKPEPVATKTCTECGTEYPAANTHCPQCGARWVDQLPAEAGPDGLGAGKPPADAGQDHPDVDSSHGGIEG